MSMSESITELAKALAMAQSEIKGAAKDSTNPHLDKKYADLASVWDACRGPLTKNGLSVAQSTRMEGSAVVVVTMLLHSSGEYIRGEISLPPTKSDPQGHGSAITYARRYALSAMVGIAPEDDDGAGASAPANPDAPRRTAVNPRTSVAAPPVETKALVDPRAAAFAQEAIAAIKTMKNDKQMVEYFVGQKAGLDRLAQAYPELWADVFCARLHRTSGETEIEHALAEQHMALMQIDAKDERLRHKVTGVADARKLAINPFGGQ